MNAKMAWGVSIGYFELFSRPNVFDFGIKWADKPTTEFSSNIEEVSTILSRFGAIGDIKTFALLPFSKKLLKGIEFMNIKYWVLILIITFFTAVINIFANFVSDKINLVRVFLTNVFGDQSALGFVSWSITAVLVGLPSAYLCKNYSPEAVGSGIPELKTILSGVNIYRYLSFKTLCVKFIVLVLILSQGLPIGKEGSFIHFGAIVAHTISSQKFFREFHDVFPKKLK